MDIEKILMCNIQILVRSYGKKRLIIILIIFYIYIYIYFIFFL